MQGVIDLIREEFSNDAEQVSAFDQALQKSGNRCYQTAFQFLQGRRGQPTANEIVRKAVMMARMPGSKLSPDIYDSYTAMEDAFRLMDLDASGWHLNPGTESLGALATNYPERFGRSILTTNFDPLIEVAIRRAGGNYSEQPCTRMEIYPKRKALAATSSISMATGTALILCTHCGSSAKYDHVCVLL